MASFMTDRCDDNGDVRRSCCCLLGIALLLAVCSGSGPPADKKSPSAPPIPKNTPAELARALRDFRSSKEARRKVLSHVARKEFGALSPLEILAILRYVERELMGTERPGPRDIEREFFSTFGRGRANRSTRSKTAWTYANVRKQLIKLDRSMVPFDVAVRHLDGEPLGAACEVIMQVTGAAALEYRKWIERSVLAGAWDVRSRAVAEYIALLETNRAGCEGLLEQAARGDEMLTATRLEQWISMHDVWLKEATCERKLIRLEGTRPPSIGSFIDSAMPVDENDAYEYLVIDGWNPLDPREWFRVRVAAERVRAARSGRGSKAFDRVHHLYVCPDLPYRIESKGPWGVVAGIESKRQSEPDGNAAGTIDKAMNDILTPVFRGPVPFRFGVVKPEKRSEFDTAYGMPFHTSEVIVDRDGRVIFATCMLPIGTVQGVTDLLRSRFGKQHGNAIDASKD